MPDVLADMFCDPVFRCCGELDQMEASLGSGEQVDCELLVAGMYWMNLANVADSVDEGRLFYDGAVLYRCHQALREQSCEKFSVGAFPNACGQDERWMEPLVQPGEFCGHDWECVDGYCSNSSSDGDGRCHLQGQPGDPCERDAECASHVCDTTTDRCEEAPPLGSEDSGICWVETEPA